MEWAALASLARRLWWLVPMIGLSVALMLTRGTLDRTKQALTAERVAHATTIVAVRTASAEAARLDAANVARVTARQTQINEEIEGDYQVNITALRARYDRLRANSAARGGGGGGAAMSAIPGAASGADGAADQDRLPPARAGLSPDDALIASEQALQLAALQAWVAAQSQINFNEEPQKETGP